MFSNFNFLFFWRFILSLLMGDFVFIVLLSCFLVYLIVGVIWEKFIVFFWKVLLMVERCGNIFERMYIVLMNFIFFIFVNRFREVVLRFLIV